MKPNSRITAFALPPLTKKALLKQFSSNTNMNADNMKHTYTSVEEWYKRLERWNILTDEIKNELIPLILGADDGN